MVRRKRHYESTRIKLDMPFEEALAKLCQATWPAESDGEKEIETSKTSVDIDRKKKRNDKPV